MEAVSIVGIAASILSAVSMFPQLVTLLKKKKTQGVSFLALGILITGLCGWVVYGFLKEDRILIIANAFAALLNSSILILAVYYRENRKGS